MFYLLAIRFCFVKLSWRQIDLEGVNFELGGLKALLEAFL